MGQLLFQYGGFFDALGRVVWGAPMALLLLGTGLYLSCRLGWFPSREAALTSYQEEGSPWST